MRAVLYSDLIAAARALGACEPDARGSFCVRMLCEADWADRYARRLGRVHPRWGDGTLAGAAGRYLKVPAVAVNDPDHLACLLLVLQTLEGKRRRSTCLQRSDT